MRFKEWLQLNEAGHFMMSDPVTITVMLDGRPTTFKDVDMVDPRFEMSNIPNPEGSKSKSNRFMGDMDYSLPLVGPQGNITMWLAVSRRDAFAGRGSRSMKSVGYEIPDINWADKAHIMGADGRDMVSAARGELQAAAAG